MAIVSLCQFRITALVYTDTLGVTALTVSTVTGFPPGIPGAFAWTGPGSSTQEITTTVAPYTEETNFGCGNPKEQYATNVPFITAYNYPDGSSLQIGYESAIANTYTGRIASITLRTGATIRYNYTGVNCGDGHPRGHVLRLMGSRPIQLSRITPRNKRSRPCVIPSATSLFTPSMVPLQSIKAYFMARGSRARRSTKILVPSKHPPIRLSAVLGHDLLQRHSLDMCHILDHLSYSVAKYNSLSQRDVDKLDCKVEKRSMGKYNVYIKV